MPSPDEDLPSPVQADTQASPVTAPAAEPPIEASGSPAPAGSPADGSGEGGGPAGAPVAASAVAPPDATPGMTAPPGGAPAAPPRKRRRRRRKKGGGQAAGAGAPGGAPRAGGQDENGETDGAATTGETDDAGESTEHDAGTEEASADGGAPKKDGERQLGGKAGKGQKKKRPDKPREKREPRERPAFGVGDVVFGKILEITDDAIIVDLSGKAKGIFDRAEMLLPDDVSETPPAKPSEPSGKLPREGEGDDGDEPHTAADVEASQASSEALPVVAESVEAAVQTGEDEPVPASDLEVPPTVTSGGVERKRMGRRIIVAAGARAAEGPATEPPVTGPVDAKPEPMTTEAGEPSADVPPIAVEAALAAPASPPDAAVAEEVSPKPAPYAPPIVLELGAHFVALVHSDGSRGGLLVLTRHPRRASQAKSLVASALRENKPVHGLVTGVVKGGVEVDVDGLRAFVPGSHMDRRPGSDLHRFIGQRLEFAVTQYGKRGRDVVLSRKAQVEAEAKASRQSALAQLAVGSIVDGVVKTVVGFGAFLDVGGVEGLVALPEMSHNRGDTPSDVFKLGETTKVKILRIDDKGKVWLSRKAAYPDPRLEAFKKYPVGSRHPAKVVRLQPFGAFLELEPGIDGLIHTLDLSMKRIEHPSEVVKVGDMLDVVVSSVDHANQKIALHPAPSGVAADEPVQRIQIHKPLKVVVVAIDAGGLVVRVLGATGRHARGFITAAATGTPRGTELRKPFPIGTQLDAKVVEFDPKRGDLKLSIKALREDTERNAYQQYRQQVSREAKFGTFGDLLAKKGLPTK
jgi:small subunit ribosomal protein S1